MKKIVAITTLAALCAGVAHARDPLAPVDTPDTCFTCSTSSDPAPSAYGSVALRAGVTIYDARFRRVAKTDARAPVVMEAAKALRGLSPDAQLRRAHEIVRARVHYMSDPDSMKVSDLWANAGETLDAGHGDDEDLAIAEMQVLKAAGFNPDDLFLTVGKSKSAGAHIVLLARTADGYKMLDQLLPEPVDADVRSASFKPVVSIGTSGSWVHGYRTASLSR
jgi:predicted transglutaminase-like cysteine proteinase